jgi:anti-sigma factor ChrR (cupin superfamily)
MSLDPFLDAVPSYVLGTLQGQDGQDFDAHLRSGCAACAAAVAELEPVVGLLARAPAPVPPGARVRDLLMDLAEAPTLPIDLLALDWQETDPGVKRAIVRHDPQRDMTGAILWAKPGARYPAHRHHGDESLLVLQGRCRDDVAEYRAGSVARKLPGSVHVVEFLPGDDCIGYVVAYGGHERVAERA